MWENVEKLLEEGKAGFEDVAQMIVYLRDASDYPVVRALFAKRFPDTPIQFVVAAVDVYKRQVTDWAIWLRPCSGNCSGPI